MKRREKKTKKKKKNKKKTKKINIHNLDFNVPQSFRPHTRCFHESPAIISHSNIINRSLVINARSSLIHRPSIQVNVPNVDVRPDLTFLA